ncbi:hypothetical protein Hanom_Chr09g00800161 [Helianthus anomalus]
MLFHIVPPTVLVRFLREHRSKWADFNVDAYSSASVKASPYGYQGTHPRGIQVARSSCHLTRQLKMKRCLKLLDSKVMQLVNEILLC